MEIRDYIKKTFIYNLYVKYWTADRARKKAQLKKYFNEENLEMLKAFTMALNSENIVFWLEFGTLLGYYREHDFIAHDFDIDTGAYWEDRDKVKTTLLKNGFKLVREYHVVDDGGLEYCFQYKHITIDVFFFRKHQDVLFCNSFYPIKNMTLFIYKNRKCPFGVKIIEVPDGELEKVKFKGCDVYVPKDCKQYLTAHYGPDFMTPKPNYNSRKDSPNITFLDYDVKPGYGVLKKLY